MYDSLAGDPVPPQPEGDPDAAGSPAAVTEFRTPHFQLEGHIASAQDGVDHVGIAWSGGALQAQLTGLSADYDLYLLDPSGTGLAESISD